MRAMRARKGRRFSCQDGPYDGRAFTYWEPMPKVIVIADDWLRYHEYHRTPGLILAWPVTYQWVRSYRIPETVLAEQISGEILAW